MVLKWMLVVIGLGCAILVLGVIVLTIADHWFNMFRFYRFHDNRDWRGNPDDDLDSDLPRADLESDKKRGGDRMKLSWKLFICILIVLVLGQFVIIGQFANHHGKKTVELESVYFAQAKRTLITEKILFDSGLWPAGVKIPEGALWTWEALTRTLNVDGPAKREPYYEPTR